MSTFHGVLNATRSCDLALSGLGSNCPGPSCGELKLISIGGACDVGIVVGTTANFGYIIDWAVRASPECFRGELIEVNPEETPLSRFATRLVREPAAIALPRIVDQIVNS